MTTYAVHHTARHKRPAGRRILAAASGAALLAGLATATTPAAAAEAPDPVLTYTFDDLTSAGDGSTVPNSGTGGSVLDARIVGEGATLVEDGHGGQALAFPGGQAGTDAPHAVIGAGLIDSGQQDLSVLARIRWDDTQSGCRYPMTIGDSSSRYLSYLAGCGRAEMRSEGSGPTAQDATIGSDTWVDLAIVLDGGTSFSLYLDGELIGQVATDYVAEDLIGEGMSGLLAQSPFAVDPYFDGTLDSMNVWDTALTSQQVAAQYNALSEYYVEDTIDGLDLGDLSSVTENLSLPSTGPAGETSIKWQSSEPESLSPTGTVSRLDEDVSGVLTATVTRGSVSDTAQFDFTVAAVSDPAAANERAAAAIVLPSVLAAGYQLPARIAARPVSWQVASGDTEITDGQISAAPEEGLSSAVLQATVGTGADAATGEFAVRIIEAEHATLAAYTTTKTTRGVDDPELQRSVHLALSADGETYTPLNSGAGVVYATAVGQDEFDNGSKRTLADPYVFRLRGSEGFGVIALRTNVDGSRTDEDARSAIVFTTPDLVHFTEVGMVELSQQATVADVAAEWDAQLQAYRIIITDPAGGLSAVSTTDWKTVTPLPDARTLPGSADDIGVEYARQANLLPVTRAEAGQLEDLLGRVHNTGLEDPEDVHVDVDGEFTLPESVTADYSDGQKHEFGVDWNQDQLEAVDTSEPGTYTIEGSLDWQPTVFPLVSGRADPHLYRYADPDTGKRSWLYISTDENGQDDLYLRQAETIEGIRTAEDHKILGRGLTGNGGQIWAPEFHEIDGDLYLVFAANVAADYDIGNIEAHTMRLEPGQDPLQADSWQEPQRVRGADGDHLAEAGLSLTIDMTYARIGGTDYVIWNERTKVDADGSPSPGGSWAPAVLKIATVDISAGGPWQLTSPPTTISVPGYSWDYNTSPVDEGPFVIQRDGTVFVTFSGSGVDETYAVGLLSAPAEADLLEASSWHKRTYPIWSNEGPISNNWGPGHNAYVRNDDGELLNVFHARPTRTGARTSGVRMVYFRTDGSPILDMRDSEWLTKENRNVAITITVGDGGEDLWTGILDQVPVSDGQHLRVHPDETRTLPLPQAEGVQWTSSDPDLIDAGTGAVTPPSSGEGQVRLTVTLQQEGQSRSQAYDLVVSQPEAEDPYGYLMAHFVEDADGYAEKIYFDLSRGDDPTQWDRLNDGEPVLASDLGSTGVRDPYLVRNPKTGTYYLMATDLRVFGCQPYTTGGWYNDCSEHSTWYHGANLSRELVLWQSQDLVNWSDPWTLTVAQPDMGMAWAPEATWDEESEQFVLYWSSKVYPSTRFPEQDAEEPGAYSQVHYGFTTDFATDFSYGGVMIDRGHDVIDTTIHQYGGSTYRISKDNGDPDTQVFMEVTDADRWWLPTTSWTTVATQIGAADYGAVEGPLIFKDNERASWYLFVDEYGGSAQGYRPYQVTGLGEDPQDIGIEKMPLSAFDMLSTTKHGVVRPLTAAQYTSLRKADSVTGIEPVEADTTVGTVPDLPETVTVTYADDRFGPSTAQRKVQWQGVSEADFDEEGTVMLTGIVEGVLPDNQFSATDAQTLRAEATVTVTAADPGEPVDARATTRCVAGAVTVVATAGNNGPDTVDVTVTSAYGERTLEDIAPGRSASAAFLTRAEEIESGTIRLNTAGTEQNQEVQVDYAAASCS